MKIGDIILYDSGYKNGNRFEYKITYIWKNAFGFNGWVDLEAVKLDITTHYLEHLSVPIHELTK